ncbi:hypothetical protein Cpap_4006 [Ruminiclostridium papyrosolvens DSM 2782]|jgi:hypothetical protein|uniref:Uncharacterized protein n=1 Tax=Ruminiclostridium papyrosolvens DSM 2782 TaxID=588581 RepID=F1T7X2_9FIRM|nr:hypothetical protein [Ruminiclostridium papyrosolvens]EGD49570.1 hypothetical protein Cpap_4006 [Ruminiclostridium papyrosolvens DSM 2782]WES33306.1 hypothetical protein P0092_16275 [Ruminiclostridium papyrosolvens DSM 2782]
MGNASKRIEDLLPRDEIDRIIEELTIEEIVLTAYDGWIYGAKTGYAELNLKTGELETGSLDTGGFYASDDYVYVVLYKIDSTTDVVTEDKADEFDDYVLEEMFDWVELDKQKIENELDYIYQYYNSYH